MKPGQLHARTISVSIDCPPVEVYDYVRNPENLPEWASGLCRSIDRQEGEWVADTPNGQIRIRFTEKNAHGVLDHVVIPEPGVEIPVPMRAVPNGTGTEVLMTIFRLPEMNDEAFGKDCAAVQKDLDALKSLLEK